MKNHHSISDIYSMAEKLLLVDDEDGIRQILGLSLADLGYDVRSVADGASALAALDEFAPDMVLTDIKMPGMDGIELLERIKAARPETEVVMLSGHGDLDLAIKSLQLDAVDFVTKPVKDEILQIALGRAKERIAVRRERREYTENLERLVEEKSARVLELERERAVGSTVKSVTNAISELAAALGAPGGDGPATFGDLPCFVSVHNKYLEIVAVNDLYRARLGDMVGQASWDVYAGRDDPSNACPVYMAFKTGKGQKSEERLIDKDGETIPALVHTAPIPGHDGEIDFVLEFSVDMTELNRLKRELSAAQEKYQSIFDASPAFISVHDRHFRIVETNRLFREHFGEGVGGRCYEVYKHRSRPCAECLVHKTIQDGESHELETVVTSRQGRQYTVLIRTSPIRDESGKIVQVMEMATDITQLRRLQDHLTSLGLMVGSVSHGVKGLLTALDGGMYKVDKGLKADDLERVGDGWRVVTTKIERIKKLVLDILYYAKARALTRDSLEVAHFVRDLELIVRPRVERQGAVFRTMLCSGLGAFEVDETALSSALVNLLENGADACAMDTAKDGHFVSLSVCANEQEVTFRIEDNGVGMDRETSQKMFTLFFSSKGTKGTGLGTYIAGQVVEEHGGRIEVDSEPGRGTRVSVTLPRFAADADTCADEPALFEEPEA